MLPAYFDHDRKKWKRFIYYSFGYIASIIVLTNCEKSPDIYSIKIDSNLPEFLFDTGAIYQFTAKAYDNSSNEISGKRFTWYSNDSLIITIDHSGKATTHNPGNTRIRAAIGNIMDSVEISVCICIEQFFSSNEIDSLRVIACSDFLRQLDTEGSFDLNEAIQNGAVDTLDGQITRLQQKTCE
jgi:hypothetical protein